MKSLSGIMKDKYSHIYTKHDLITGFPPGTNGEKQKRGNSWYTEGWWLQMTFLPH